MNECNDVISHTNSIFQQPFWLDAVAPNSWDAVEAKSGGEVKARLPYVISRNRLGMTLLSMPPLTQTLGPWLAVQECKYAKQLAQQKDLMGSLIEQLPPHDYFAQSFHYSIENWLPFYWKGFTETSRYTYVIDNLEDLDQVWSGFMQNIRTDIRKAEKQVIVREDMDVERFLAVNALTFKRQGEPLPYTADLIHRIDKACARRGSRRIFFAEDAEGRIHSAIYIIWDKDSAYYLMGGSDPDLRNSGANSLLLWKAICFAATVTKKFDFEGSMMEPVERFCRAFGARQKLYFTVSRMGRSMSIVQNFRGALRTLKYAR